MVREIWNHHAGPKILQSAGRNLRERENISHIEHRKLLELFLNRNENGAMQPPTRHIIGGAYAAASALKVTLLPKLTVSNIVGSGITRPVRRRAEKYRASRSLGGAVRSHRRSPARYRRLPGELSAERPRNGFAPGSSRQCHPAPPDRDGGQAPDWPLLKSDAHIGAPGVVLIHNLRKYAHPN